MARKRLVAKYGEGNRKYELNIILKQSISEVEVNKKLGEFEAICNELGSKVFKKVSTKLRSFAYPIESKNNLKGFFACLYIETSADSINEVKRRISLEDGVLRTLIILHNPKKLSNGIFEKNYEDDSDKPKKKSLSYDDPNYLIRFIGERGRIEARRQSLGKKTPEGLALKQRKISREIKRSRFFSLLPYLSD